MYRLLAHTHTPNTQAIHTACHRYCNRPSHDIIPSSNETSVRLYTTRLWVLYDICKWCIFHVDAVLMLYLVYQTFDAGCIRNSNAYIEREHYIPHNLAGLAFYTLVVYTLENDDIWQGWLVRKKKKHTRKERQGVVPFYLLSTLHRHTSFSSPHPCFLCVQCTYIPIHQSSVATHNVLEIKFEI